MSDFVDERSLAIARLRKRRGKLERRLGRVESDRRHAKEPLSADFEEQAVERENDEVLDGLDALERRELDKIDLAMRRVDSGCFGICDDCGEDIDPLRLEAEPAAARCIACAKALEAS